MPPRTRRSSECGRGEVSGGPASGATGRRPPTSARYGPGQRRLVQRLSPAVAVMRPAPWPHRYSDALTGSLMNARNSRPLAVRRAC